MLSKVCHLLLRRWFNILCICKPDIHFREIQFIVSACLSQFLSYTFMKVEIVIVICPLTVFVVLANPYGAGPKWYHLSIEILLGHNIHCILASEYTRNIRMFKTR